MRRCPQGMPMAENPENKQRWYALRVTYGREMLVKGYLDGIGVESYIPMHFARRTYGERTRKVWEPLIHNLLFIRTSADRLREIKATTTLPIRTSAVRLKEIKACTTLPIRYIMDRETKAPTVIPDNQMRDFMAVVATRNEHVEIVAPQDVDLAGGDAVRVTGGVFAGIEGRYIRHKGHSKVAVAIKDIATALTAYVPLRYIEKINQQILLPTHTQSAQR